MKTVSKFVTGVIVPIAILITHSAFADITLDGMVPAHPAALVIIKANNYNKAAGVLKFKFSAPAATPAGYVLSFCIGPVANPCGLPTSYVVDVPASEGRLAVVDASFFKDKVLTVNQGTSQPLPFSVTIE